MNRILLKIALELKPVDIREVIGKNNDAETLKENHYVIAVIDQLLNKSKELGYDFCNKNGFIYFFNGQYWQEVSENDIRYILRTTARKIGIERVKARYYKFIDSLTKQFISETIKPQIKQETDITINLLNGTFQFGDVCKLREFKKEDFLTYQLPFEYQPEAKSPLFEAYINKVLPDLECQNILAEFLGYVFTPGHKQQKCLLLYGGGANGKSVFFDIVRALMGKENITSFSLRNLGEENSRALISNKLLNYSSEIDAFINRDTFKQLCSGEPLQARLKYRDSFMMDNYAKLMFNCNELPKDVEHSNAYFRRFLIIPFTQTIPEVEQDRFLADKIIAAELSGIFNWVLSGLERLTKQEKFTESAAVNNALTEFKQESDSVYQFLTEMGYDKSDEGKYPLSHLYKEYDQYCRDNGYKALNMRNFKSRLELRGINIKRVASGNRVYLTKKAEPVIIDEELPF